MDDIPGIKVSQWKFSSLQFMIQECATELKKIYSTAEKFLFDCLEIQSKNLGKNDSFMSNQTGKIW